MDDKTKPCGDFYLSILNTNSTNLTNKYIPPPAAEIQKSWRKSRFFYDFPILRCGVKVLIFRLIKI